MRYILVLICLTFSMVVHSADRKNIFADPDNLKVLPKDISPDQLRNVMRSFSMSLGLRCNDCHKGEKGKPLSSYDFAADDKELKKKARIMMKMVNHINHDQITKLDAIKKGDRVQVTCMTCHRAQAKPELIQNVLARQLEEKGIEAVVAKYGELRKQYYGGHTFDFGENVLPMFSSKFLSDKSQSTNAVKLLEANIGYFPESFFGFYSLGSAYQTAGDADKAISAYKKALELNPKANFVRKRLEGLTKAE